MEKNRIQTALGRARAYMDALTVDSPVNVPEEVAAGEGRFFTWDNERRSPGEQTYLFHWSYYNGVVMEGLFDMYLACGDGRYLDYVRRYLDALIVTGEDGQARLSRTRAGYVDCHGADCYKTAALLVRLAGEDPRYAAVCRELYRDLTDPGHVNSAGHIPAREYTEAALGYNYWHTWRGGRPPRYRVWLDGLYMLQPFLARYAAGAGDEGQLALVNRRLDWAAETMRGPDGLYWHAANSREDVCPYHWTRAMGWYGMAMADVTEVLPEAYWPQRRAALRQFAEGVLRYQREDGLWNNVADWRPSETNRPEVSGTAMMAYTLLKAVRLGLLEERYREAGVRAFVGIAETKLAEGRLWDIYLKASANGRNNYEDPACYLPDEGKGVGPFGMAAAEMMYLG